MTSVSYDEASRCPKCGNSGELKQQRPGPDRSEIHILTCQNKVCRWYQTDWVVQRLEDGTVPVRETTEKTFPKMHLPPGVKSYLDSIKDQDANR